MNQTAASVRSNVYLKQRWTTLHEVNPHIHIRDAARQLQASEAQLVATGCGETAVRLTDDWRDLVKHLPLLGRVMALTRNEHAVHEQQGTYEDVRVSGDSCLVRGEDIDLRLSLAHWHCGFAVCESTLSGSRFSLQFFDRDGSAVHKIYLTDDSDPTAYYTLTCTYRSGDQGTTQDVATASPESPSKPDRAVDVDRLRSEWGNLRDSRSFLALLSQLHVTRLQALRLAGAARAWRVAPSSLRLVLESARDAALPIRTKVGNPGALQVCTGAVHNARPVGDWYSVLNADFNLHVREAAVHSAWVVTRPTVSGSISGVVTSMELFDAQGGLIARLLGKERSGIPEDLAWRRLANALPRLAAEADSSLTSTREVSAQCRS